MQKNVLQKKLLLQQNNESSKKIVDGKFYF